MASCGISLNLSSLESSISGHISTALGFAGMSGIPFMPQAIKAAISISNGNILAAIKIMVPPEALDSLWGGLRDGIGDAFSSFGAPDLGSIDGIAVTQSQLTGFQNTIANTIEPGSRWEDLGVDGSYDAFSDPALAGSWGSTDTFLGKLGEIGSEFVADAKSFAEKTGLDQLSGYVDINVTDLAKTAIGLGASWDSCDFGTAGIQNYFKDPATGTVKLLANYAPKLGDTSVAVRNNSVYVTGAVNTLFNIGKSKTQLSLNAVIGDVVTAGVDALKLDSLGTTVVSPQNIANMNLFLAGQNLPSDIQTLRKKYDGTTYIDSPTLQGLLLRDKIKDRYSAEDSSLQNLNVLNSDKYPDFFSVSASVNI